jgi:DNA-binding transcriptional MerR regulator
MRAGYSTLEAAAATGLTYRQLDYSDRMGFVKPSLRAARGPGSQRCYAYRDIAEACILARFGRSGADLERGAKALGGLRETLFQADYLILRPDGSNTTATTSNLLSLLGD